MKDNRSGEFIHLSEKQIEQFRQLQSDCIQNGKFPSQYIYENHENHYLNYYLINTNNHSFNNLYINYLLDIKAEGKNKQDIENKSKSAITDLFIFALYICKHSDKNFIQQYHSPSQSFLPESINGAKLILSTMLNNDVLCEILRGRMSDNNLAYCSFYYPKTNYFISKHPFWLTDEKYKKDFIDYVHDTGLGQDKSCPIFDRNCQFQTSNILFFLDNNLLLKDKEKSEHILDIFLDHLHNKEITCKILELPIKKRYPFFISFARNADNSIFEDVLNDNKNQKYFSPSDINEMMEFLKKELANVPAGTYMSKSFAAKEACLERCMVNSFISAEEEPKTKILKVL